MNKIGRIVFSYLLSVGAGTVLLAILSIFLESFDYMGFIRAFSAAFILPNIVYVLTERQGVSKTELWLRRLLSFMTYPICMTFFFAVFVVRENLNGYLLRCALMLIPEIVLYIVFVMAAEYIIKKNLKKINDKLSKNIGETEK